MKKPPTRLWIACMIFFSVFTTYVIRLHFNLLIVAMVKERKGIKKPPACDPTRNMTSTKTYSGEKFDWNQRVQGQLIGSYNYGFILTNILGGAAAEYFGPKKVIFWSNLISGVLTLVTSFSARIHYGVVFACRFLLGMLGGVLYPGVQSLIANWAPPAEKGKFVALLMGNTIGSVVCLPTVGAIADIWNYDAAFIVSGVFVLVFCAVFYVLVSDRPHDHWFISEEERQYILDSQEGKVSKVKRVAPYLKIFTNIPFLSAALGHFGNMWGIFFQMTMIPKFSAEVLGFNLKSAGAISALPYLARFFSGVIFGFIGDIILKKELMSKVWIRRLFTISSHIIPGILLGTIILAECRVTIVVVLLVTSLMFNGAAVLTILQSPHDLAPSFAGTLFGIMQTIAAPPGFIIPLITAEFIKDNNGIDEWKWIFLIGSVIYILAGVVFMVFCSGKLQEFNDYKKENADAPAAT